MIDGDPLYGDVASVIGVPADASHTFADLAPLGDELTPAHLEETLWQHPTGFRVLPGPSPESAGTVRPGDLTRVVESAAIMADAVVVHLPRALDGLAQAGLRSADRVVEVLSLDVLSFRAATRALEAFGPLHLSAPVGFVVNRVSRAEITPADVERVFGAAPLAVFPADRAVGRAQDRGRLMPPKGRLARAFDRLAARLLESEVVEHEAS
jgi:Flp pilus assembly CpaE family ATPase